MVELAAAAPLLFSLGLLLSAALLLGRESRLARALGAAVGAAVALRYAWWHATAAMPEGQAAWQTVYAWAFLLIETGAIASAVFGYLFMSRRLDRSAEADARAGSPLAGAPVDVLIATYNEGHEILERTVVGALHLDHPDLRVFVLDDGKRPWVRELAGELGVRYVARADNRHAKAGNVNNGLRVALEEGRRAEFVLLLDADFVPNRRLLRRTLPLFEAADVGIVQTPQHFFNPDPLQANLFCAEVWPDEQRLFFNELLPCKDAWDAAFCCGTSAVLRVAAMRDSGGLATETVTEDMLTSFKMREFGWRTIFLNEVLSLGLAPESLKEYISQRSRWCLGAVQQVYTRWSFLGRGRIGLLNRLACLDTFLYWACGFPFRLLMLLTPILYWWSGTAVIRGSLEDMLYWLAPHVLCGMAFTAIFSHGRAFPIMTDVNQLLPSIAITRSVITGLLRPHGHAFKVTAKGLSTSGVTVQWRLMWPFLLLAAGLLGGLLLNISPYSAQNGAPGYAINVLWSLYGLTVLAITIAACVEEPKRRTEERFPTDEAAVAVLPDGRRWPCRVVDLSLTGARMLRPAGWEGLEGEGVLQLDAGGLVLPFRTVRSAGPHCGVAFMAGAEGRRALIRKLYTGGYHREVRRISLAATMAGILRKVFA
ncbi:glycosyltransferase [Roseomonas sp. M0104]|uniref:Glycosyltransferase n=1 Tax=Teichococcus coralli TaxID=2545983 RepID=A0A845BHM2_9PROT|nr:glycosyltransferase [Pseudoroseomonas coralli]MXP64702.1 glycosyltransferase [Pseudoroseomonas coralli]